MGRDRTGPAAVRYPNPGDETRPRARRSTVLAAALLPMLLGACSSVPEWADPTAWFDEEEDEAPSRISSAEESGRATTFPNLASVPDAPPVVTSAPNRDKLRSGLAADLSNAEYSGQRLTGQGGAAAPQGATVPGAPPVPAIASRLTGQATPTAAAAPAAPQTGLGIRQFQTAAANPAAANSQGELVAVIYFGHGATTLAAADRGILSDVLALHRERGGAIRVVGHASARTRNMAQEDRRAANLETSRRRADAVANRLVALGAARGSVRVEARADAQPVYHEFMPTGEAGNRRAEIYLEY